MNHNDPLMTAALFPLGLIFVTDGPTSTIALAGVLATLIAGLIGRYLDNRKDDKRHAWELAERLAAAAEIRADLLTNRAHLNEAIAQQKRESSQQMEYVRAALSEEHSTVAGQVQGVENTVQAIREKQLATSPVQDELTTRLAIGKLLHDLFNAKQVAGEEDTAEAKAFQLVNQHRIQELGRVISS